MNLTVADSQTSWTHTLTPADVNAGTLPLPADIAHAIHQTGTAWIRLSRPSRHRLAAAVRTRHTGGVHPAARRTGVAGRADLKHHRTQPPALIGTGASSWCL